MKNHFHFVVVSKIIFLSLLIQFKPSFSQTVQQRLDSGESPKQIFNSGFPLDSIYGKTYEGGMIFYLDTIIGNGLVCAPEDQSTGAEWGCDGTSIEGTSGALYAGNSNTNAIVTGCSSPGIAARLCYDLTLSSHSDWYLPSRSELGFMYSNLYLLGFGDFNSGNYGGYWSSIQYDPNYALVTYFSNGNSQNIPKNETNSVRAIRCFCTPNTCPCQVSSMATHEMVQWEIFQNEVTPDFTELLNTEAIPSQISGLDSLNVRDFLSTLDYFSSRIRGYIIPPVSGTYSFYFACDDAGQFWLSTDTASASAVIKSQTDTIQTDWTQNISSQDLVAGQKYFFEILQYDSVYKNMIKLGWVIPGDSIPTTISSSYMIGYHDSISVSNLKFVKDSILVYPQWNITPQYHIKPWNAAYKTVIWKSSNNSIATVNVDGVITSISPGTCQIIIMSALNNTLTDTLHLTVADYYGPFFVKQNAALKGDGHSWDDAINLTKLLNILNQGTLIQNVNVYVAEGIYKPTTTIDRNKSFILNNIRIVGGFPDGITGTDTTNRDVKNYETLLSGEIGIPTETTDNSYHVVITRDTAIIDGFTIRDGRANCRYYGEENYYDFGENSGGGIILQSEKAFIYNCKVINNSAFNGGAGIFCGSQSPDPGGVLWGKKLTIANSQISDNIIQQTVDTGSMFTIVVNGYGAGITVIHGDFDLRNSILNHNITPWGYGTAMYMVGCTANIENCSIYRNTGYYEDLWINGSSTLNMTNSTLTGRFVTAANSNTNIINSTIIGGGYTAFDGNHLLFDNSIWTEPNLIFYEGTVSNTWQAKYSILGDTLYGADKNSVISNSIPSYTTWLDSLAYNGGPTPTMKLKNIPGNYALNYGNPLYLDSTDQRGAIRANFVSIGAYQWVDATEIVISPHQITLTQGDSTDFEVYFLPAFSSDGLYTVSCSDNSIARLDSSMIYAIKPGFVNIIAQSVDGMMRDTLVCEVIANAGIEEVSQYKLFKVYPNPVKNQLFIESNESAGIINYEILNTFGKLVSKGFFTQRTVINMSDFRAGLYFIICTTDKEVEILKIVKNQHL